MELYNEAVATEFVPTEQPTHHHCRSIPITMTSPPLGPFDRAREKVWNNLKDEEKSELTGTCTIEDVWEIAKRIQKNQGKRRELGNMNKIRPYLDGLKRYEDVINVFISSNPVHAALIWVGFTLLNSIVPTDMV